MLYIVFKKNNKSTSSIGNVSASLGETREYNYHLKYFLNNKIGYFFQAETKEDAIFISRLVAPNGVIMKWSVFRDSVIEKIPEYDVETLEKEYNGFYMMAQMYEKWKSVEENKREFPYLKYSAVHDDYTCKTCSKLHNIVTLVDDPFWDIYYPPNCPECRCVVEQGDRDDFKKLTDLSKKNLIVPLNRFAINVGKVELKLPY